MSIFTAHLGPVQPVVTTSACPKCGEVNLAVIAVEVTVVIGERSTGQGVVLFCTTPACSFQVPITRGADD
jgi:hypothetical protein